MRVRNNQSELIFLSADQLQELTSLLLHQAKSPLVATAGFVEMVDLSGKTSQVVNDKLLSYAQKSNQRALKLIDMIEVIAMLNTASPEVIISPIRLDSVIDGVFRGEVQTEGMRQFKYKLLRSYKLPLVLADRSRLNMVLHQLGDMFSQHAGRSEVVEISFRIRGDYEVIRFLAPSLGRVLAIAKPVFLKKVNLAHLVVKGDSELVVQSFIIRRQIELMGGFVKVEAKRGQPTALYIHLPLARQLQLSLLSANAKIG